MMRIHIGESDRWKGRPLHQALAEAMRANEIAGVTVYRGVLGYGAHRRLHKGKPLHLSHDCSNMLAAINTEDKFRAFPPIFATRGDRFGKVRIMESERTSRLVAADDGLAPLRLPSGPTSLLKKERSAPSNLDPNSQLRRAS